MDPHVQEKIEQERIAETVRQKNLLHRAEMRLLPKRTDGGSRARTPKMKGSRRLFHQYRRHARLTEAAVLLDKPVKVLSVWPRKLLDGAIREAVRRGARRRATA